MKKARANLLFLLLLCAAGLPCPTHANPLLTVVKPVNLRRDASTQQPPIRLLQPGEQLVWLGQQKANGFLSVKTAQGETGWVWESNVAIKRVTAPLQTNRRGSLSTGGILTVGVISWLISFLILMVGAPRIGIFDGPEQAQATFIFLTIISGIIALAIMIDLGLWINPFVLLGLTGLVHIGVICFLLSFLSFARGEIAFGATQILGVLGSIAGIVDLYKGVFGVVSNILK